jgi:hypothetical protein
VGVQVRHRVAEHVVVELDRGQHLLQRAPDAQYLAAVGRRLGVGELRRLDHVAPTPDDHREPALDVRADEVGVGDRAREEAHGVRRGLGAPLVAQRAGDAGAPVVEGRGPLHAPSVAEGAAT